MKATRKCSFCGKSFVTRSGMQRYCSEACQAEARRARMTQKNNLFKAVRPLMEIQHQEYLTFSKAAILMGCSRQYIYKLVAMGKLKASRISNRMAFIRRADIERMLEGNPYHRILPGSTSTPKKSASSSFPGKKEKREKGGDEILDFYSGEEVMSLYKVKQSWLYTTAKRNRIPTCRIAGKNYYSKKHVDEFFGVAVDMDSITDWLLTEEAEEQFGMKPAALRAYAYRHRIPTKREYGRTYYSKSHLDELRRTDLVNDERYYTVEQVRQIYGLSSANICHIVKVKHIEKIKVGVKNLLLRSDVERVMAERNKQPQTTAITEKLFQNDCRGGIHGCFTLFLCHREHGDTSGNVQPVKTSSI